MNERRAQSVEFLKTAGWDAAERLPLADDASFRRYERLIRIEGGHRRQAVLMDAPPAFEDVRPFIAIARHLQSLGLAAPKILAEDLARGFLLLEDMGDQLFARVIAQEPAREADLYRLAVRGLVRLHQSVPPERIPVTPQISYSLPRYDLSLLLPEVSLFADWYLPALTGRPLSDRERDEFLALWRAVLTPVASNLTHLVLRDYHAENLMWLDGRAGLDSLGLLDFQDGVIGHRAYDLASLLQDARRDVSPALEQEMLRFYGAEMTVEPAQFHRDYTLLAAQRNAKIIGIFSRLHLRDGKSVYLKLIPRVWGLLNRDLDHPALAPVKAWIDRYVPMASRTADFSPQPAMPRKAMILAAGLGLRMRPLTDNCPKPLLRVAGREILAHILDGLLAGGINQVVVNMHYLADQVKTFAENYPDPRLKLTLSDERDELMDSGGGVRQALPHLGDDPFFVLNSDLIWRDGARQMLHRLRAFWRDDRMDILMLLAPRGRAFGYDGPGDYNLQEDGRLRHRGADDRADHVYAGVMIIKPACFADAPDGPFSLRWIFDRAARHGRLYGVLHDGEWYHVGTPEALGRLEEILNKGD